MGAKGKEDINKEVKRLWNTTTVVERGTIKRDYLYTKV
jgi:hypothetical protein